MKKRHALFLPTSLRIGAYALVSAALLTISGTVSAADAKADAKAPVQKVTETQAAKQTAPAPKKDAKASAKDTKAAKPAKPQVKQKTPQEIALEKRNARFAAVLKKVDQAEKFANNDYKNFDQKAIENFGAQLEDLMKQLDALANEYKGDKDFLAKIEKQKNRCTTLNSKLLCNVRDAKLEAVTKKLAQAEMLANDKNKKYNEALEMLKGIKKEIEGIKFQSSYVSQLKARCEADIVCVREICGELLYQEAKETYAKALKVSGTEKGAELAKEAKKIAYESRALFYTGDRKASDTDTEKNINKLNDSQAKLVDGLAAQCDKIVKYTDFRTQTKLDKVDMTYFDRVNDIEKMLAKAEKQYRNKQYTQARKTCEEIFIRDPFNPDAVRLLDKVYRKLYFYAELRNYNEMLRNDAETIWSWVPAIPDTSDRKITAKSRPLSDPLLEKLNGWIIDVEYGDYTILDIITDIREKCKKIDPNKIGLNIQTTPALNKEPYVSTPITLNLKKTPVNVVLDYVTKLCGVSWTTDRDGLFVTIGPDLGDHENRDIPMRVTVYRSITNKEDGDDADNGKKDDGAWGGGGIAAGVEASVSKKKTVTDQDLKRFFEERGILFDAQSSISYNQRTHLLSATNKREQLIKLENLVREIDVEAPLVMVEAKILEIQLNDQEELGFDWIITSSGDSANWDYGMASPLRDFGLGANKLINNLNVVPNLELGDMKININLTVTAVDRTDRVEILSTPKVVAKTGEEAEIKMARQMYFPESWSEPDTSNINGDSLEFQPSYPEFGDARDVGLTFVVTPTVSSNNRTIELDLHPQITDLTGWTDYSYDVTIGAASTTTVAGEEDEEEGGTTTGGAKTTAAPTTSHITMKMPEISNREVQTKVKVEDGSTVLIGGLITDQQCNYEDKFPILGDVPVFGRLFSKIAETKARVNLLISVSPRLISGDGQPLRDNTAPVGVPDFYR